MDDPVGGNGKLLLERCESGRIGLSANRQQSSPIPSGGSIQCVTIRPLSTSSVAITDKCRGVHGQDDRQEIAGGLAEL